MRPAIVATGPARASSIPGLARSALRDCRELAVDYAALAVVDARSAAVRLAWLLSAGLVVAVLTVTAWLALVAGALVWLLGAGVTWPAALGIGALVNVIGATIIALWMRGLLVSDPPFSATLRQLRGEEVPHTHGERDEARR
jgi:hypothetical protein